MHYRRVCISLQVLPRLADILSSRAKLLRCFEAAAEGADASDARTKHQGMQGSS